MAPRKSFLLRLDPAVHDALAAWAAAEFRSVNGHVEWVLRDALKRAGHRIVPRAGEPASRTLGLDDADGDTLRSVDDVAAAPSRPPESSDTPTVAREPQADGG